MYWRQHKMPGAAYAGGNSVVTITDGKKGTVCEEDDEGTAIKWHWDAAKPTSATGAATITKVKIDKNRFPVVKDDVMASHPDGEPCVAAAQNHTPALDTYSSKVFFEGENAGRIGDTFNKDHTFDHEITSGSSKVLIGG